MTRAISIVLIVAIALQTVGCSTWKPLARMNEVPEDNRQASMRDQVLGKLKEGMRVRIRIREGSAVPVIGQVIECVIERVGLTSLTITASAQFFFPDNLSRRLTLRYSDIESVEYRESDNSGIFVLGVGVGAVLGFLLFQWGLSGIELD